MKRKCFPELPVFRSRKIHPKTLRLQIFPLDHSRRFTFFQIAVDTIHIRGEMTHGENIADLGGIVMGFDSFKKTKQYNEGEIIAGLTPHQRFFLGYAFAWMINDRPEAIANQVRSDVPSPAKYRVIGPLSNMPEFDAAFGVKEGDVMWRPDSLIVRIW